MLFLIVILTLASALRAAEPQLVWKGEVEGAVLLRVQKKQVVAEAADGRVIGRPRFRFAHPLPQQRQEARVEVLEGRGSVQILEQPGAGNSYSLVARIEDPQPGAVQYSLAFYWDAQIDASAELKVLTARRRESLTWTGRAEGDVVVSCRGESCEAATSGGVPVPGGRCRFTKPLPGRETFVALAARSGRGDLRLIEQPAESNQYTARVLIRDPHAGSSDYSFKLAWLPAKNQPLEVPPRAGMYWSGRVQGAVRVTVHGRIAATSAIAGGSVTGVRAQFERGLPQLETANLTLRKLRGRGDVRVVEYPSKTNGWTLVFEAADSGPGADDYDVELRW